MEFDPFNLSVKDLSTWNVIAKCNSSEPCTRCTCPHIPLLHHLHLLGIDVSATLVLTSYPSYLMILVSFALGALMTFALLASYAVIFVYLLSVLILMRIIILI
jgi:hypothetical protein